MYKGCECGLGDIFEGDAILRSFYERSVERAIEVWRVVSNKRLVSLELPFRYNNGDQLGWISAQDSS